MEKVMIRYIERHNRADGTKARVGGTEMVEPAEARKLEDAGQAVIVQAGPTETKPAAGPAETTTAPRKTAKK